MNTPSTSIEKLQESMGLKPSNEPAWLVFGRIEFQFHAISAAKSNGDKHIGTTSEMVMTFERPDGTRYLIQAPVMIKLPAALGVTKSAAELIKV